MSIDPRTGDTSGHAVPITDRFSVAGKTVLVTGASSGLGAGFTRALVGAGADVLAVARRAERLAALAEELADAPGTIHTHTADVADPEQCQQAAAAAVDRLDSLEVVVNNAGLGTAVPALKETPEQFRQVVEVNLEGTYWMAQAAAARMQPGGSIINIASVLGITAGNAPQAAYTATKTAVIGLTRDLAAQWGSRKGLRVNAIAPGYFASEMTDEIPAEMLEAITQKTQLGRLGLQYELDAAVVYLASDASSFTTGTTMVVDGGMTLH